jgi:hypothetical protein
MGVLMHRKGFHSERSEEYRLRPDELLRFVQNNTSESPSRISPVNCNGICPHFCHAMCPCTPILEPAVPPLLTCVYSSSMPKLDNIKGVFGIHSGQISLQESGQIPLQFTPRPRCGEIHSSRLTFWYACRLALWLHIGFVTGFDMGSHRTGRAATSGERSAPLPYGFSSLLQEKGGVRKRGDLHS